MKVSDVELVSRTLDGDHEAFKTLVWRYQDMVYGVAYAYLRNFHDAQDVTQEILLKAYRNLTTYDMERPFSAWLYTIAKRTTLDWIRCRKVYQNFGNSTEEIVDAAPGPEDIVEKHEMEQLLSRAITHLSDVNRETFCLYYVDGYSIKEISQFLSVPQGTVKRRLHVSRKQLQEEVMEMVEETFEQNKLTWDFTQDVVNKVKGLKSRLTDYLPEEFRELGQMTSEELNERQNKLLRSLADVLSVDLEKLKLDRKHHVSVSELTSEQREYLWKTLHELELMEIISMLREGTIFTQLIEDFGSTKVELGLYKKLGNPYVRLFRSKPDENQHQSVQMGLKPIDE